MSLRARLVLATLALVAVGLLVAGVAIYGLMRSFLLDRLDQQVRASRFAAARALEVVPKLANLVPFEAGGDEPPTGTWVAVLDREGEVLRSYVFTFDDEGLPPPELPSDLPGTVEVRPGSAARTGPRSTMFTAESEGGGERYRVSADALTSGGTLVVAIPLTDVTDTLRRLVLIELVVSAIVLAAAGASA